MNASVIWGNKSPTGHGLKRSFVWEKNALNKWVFHEAPCAIKRYSIIMPLGLSISTEKPWSRRTNILVFLLRFQTTLMRMVSNYKDIRVGDVTQEESKPSSYISNFNRRGTELKRA
ncbi:hypothetical protein C5167_029666 [Papaver somniferum]|nr:hypothetical protein C5167_029666 [Papaver somniferum]